MALRVFHVDAFTKTTFKGNPAAVCPLAAWLDDQRMQAVAAENNLSETAFFVGDHGKYELRWFSPKVEVQLCGHATLASGFVVLNFLEPELESVRFTTRYGGILTVSRTISRSGELLSMDFPALPSKTCVQPPKELLQGLRTESGLREIFESNENYFAVFEEENAVQRINPNFALLERLHPFGVCVTARARERGVDFVSRYFAPSYGIPEDPVTGSTHCSLAPYWSERLGKKSFRARQVSTRGGEILCAISGDRVVLQGHTVLTLQGTFLI